LSSDEYVKSRRVLNPLESTGHRGKKFLSSLIGIIIGLTLFFGVGPYLIYKSEFQYTAQNFAKATLTDSSLMANGYIYIYDIPTLITDNPCMILTEKQCIYYDYQKEQEVEKTGVKCGSDADTPGVIKISQAPDECRKEFVREGGKDVEREVCKKCWNAKWKEWEKIDTKLSIPEFKLGMNIVNSNTLTTFMSDYYSTGEYKIENQNYRESVNYIDTSNNVLVVGNANNGIITSGNPFVISNKNYEATKEIIKQKQKTSTFILKLLGFFCFLFGVYLILQPIKTFIEIFGGIPILGNLFVGLGGLTGFLLFGISLLLALVLTTVLTILFKILRLFVDNILVVFIVSSIVGALIIFVVPLLFRKKKSSGI